MTSSTDSPPNLALRAVRTAREDACGGKVEADDAARALRLALHAAHITLPDLQADDCACGYVTAGPLVELGNVRPDVALRLAEVISHGAAGRALRVADGGSLGDVQ